MEKLTVTSADIQEFGKMMKKMSFFVAMNISLVEKILNRITLYKYNRVFSKVSGSFRADFI